MHQGQYQTNALFDPQPQKQGVKGSQYNMVDNTNTDNDPLNGMSLDSRPSIAIKVVL